MLTELSLAGHGDNVVNAGVEEVDAAVAVAATEGGQGDKLDNRRYMYRAGDYPVTHALQKTLNVVHLLL
jgi:hypothetical protein